MNIYIWVHLDRMSSSYHSDGGVVIVAETVERARELFLADYKKSDEDVDEESDIVKAPDYTYGCDATEERMFLFPDAGCC